MTFYINSNLSPTEAVRYHKELQVHPVIAEWAEKAETFQDECQKAHDDGYKSGKTQLESDIDSDVKDRARDIFNDSSLTTVEDIKAALKELINE